MKKKGTLLCLLFASLAVLTGCSQDSASKYVGEQITSMKEKDADTFSVILEDGKAASNKQFVLQFPEELTAPYQEFLQNSFKTIEFEVAKAKKKENGDYTVQITYTPLNIQETLTSDINKYADTMETTDLTAEVTSLLSSLTGTLSDSPVYNKENISVLDVKQEENGYVIEPESLKTFLSQALYGYMTPYDAICEIMDARGALLSYLDASFKGEVTQFAKYTDRTEEEALAWYEEDTFTPPSDLSEAYIPRYQEAMKNILKQSNYTVGVPRKDTGGFNYNIDVTVLPNNSLVDAVNEFEQGTYYSLEEASAGLVTTLEKYATSPTYGEETVVQIPLNMATILTSGEEDSEFANLANTILPVP